MTPGGRAAIASKNGASRSIVQRAVAMTWIFAQPERPLFSIVHFGLIENAGNFDAINFTSTADDKNYSDAAQCVWAL